ncbi:hypothetical protein D9757_008494 [Collybiopsis confluens]|uniref:Uncharacterized protein n=1 Tax=Collybiopsis confluens TaxID=2823264 RepID=A0A8H5M6B0_9AGAR|nr:hypothetical protein D9757_008494 [Collybiopsis confluens]
MRHVVLKLGGLFLQSGFSVVCSIPGTILAVPHPKISPVHSQGLFCPGDSHFVQNVFGIFNYSAVFACCPLLPSTSVGFEIVVAIWLPTSSLWFGNFGLFGLIEGGIAGV